MLTIDPAGVGRQPRREILDQHERRTQIDREMPIPALAASPSRPCRCSKTAALLTRQPSGPSARSARGTQRTDRVLVGEIGARAPAPRRPWLRIAAATASAASRERVVMHRHRTAVLGQRQRDGPADPLRRRR